jgi:retinol dehydrogenase-12
VLSELGSSGADATYLPLDLGELASVRACAARFLSLGEPLHVLLNNAGLAGSHGTTVDGFERTFGVNHLGPFLLTELLLERLLESAPSRIVNVASKAHYNATGIDWAALRQPTATRIGMQEYNVSKLCNVLYAQELSRRLAGARGTTYSQHPRVNASEVWGHVPWGLRHLMLLFMQSNREGAATSVHCAASEAAEQQSALYYDACKPTPPSALAEDVGLADTLVQTSSAWVVL